MTEELAALDTAKPRRAGGLNQMLIDLGPLLVFIVAFNVFNRIPSLKADAVYIATAIFIVATLATIAYSWLRHRHVPPVLIVTGVIVVAFGGLTLALHDPIFIQIKPTFVNLFYVAAILFSLAIKKNVWKLLFRHTFNLPDRIWTILALRWAGCFAVQAAINEYIRQTQTFEVWANTRPLVVYPLVIAFALLNTPIVLKHHREDESAPKPVAPAA
ncbi:MAG: septation protein IspZ [Phycisphaerales bacterium]|nr:septation protein IspZ [Hyphomonadaceae bacterium]